MYILLQSNYDIPEARRQLAKRRVKKEPWSEDDAIVFKQALQSHGKHFQRIRQFVRAIIMRGNAVF